MVNQNFDLVVIGSGSGGLGAALGMLGVGFKVLLVEKDEKKIGGECLNTGCVPSKALLHVAKKIYQARTSGRYGLEVSGEVKIEEVKNYIKEKQNSIRSHENIDYFRKKGLDVELGTASFISSNQISVGGKIFTGKNIVIATGSTPRKIDIKGASTIPVFTNESIFEIDFIPSNFVFIGAGPVSIELGQAFSRLGSKVSVVDRQDRILGKEDPVISQVLLDRLKLEGMEFYFHSEVTEIESGNTAIVKSAAGKKRKIPVDAIFMGLGRQFNFDSLDLGKAGIETADGKIVLNDRLQTTNSHVYVCGDAADNLKFSHAAELHNILLIKNFLSPIKKELDFDHFPWVTFTEPEIATFGLNEEKLKERDIDYERLEASFGEEDRAITEDFEYGKLILFVEKKRFMIGNAKILGGSMIAPNAGEITQELILTNHSGIPLKDFMNKIYAYPTAGNIHKVIARNRFVKQIRPWMKRFLLGWYRLKE